MENHKIWLQPKPTHIDDYFDNFLVYLQTNEGSEDMLYEESLNLMNERINLLLDERFDTPIYHPAKTLTFYIRLCGAWLLTYHASSSHEHKQVLLTLTNLLTSLCMTVPAIKDGIKSVAQKSVDELLLLSVKIITHRDIKELPFTLDDILEFRLEPFLLKYLQLQIYTPETCIYEHRGMLWITNKKINLSPITKAAYEKSAPFKKLSECKFLTDENIYVLNHKEDLLKKSQQDDLEANRQFICQVIDAMRQQKPENKKRLKTYFENERVEVEVVTVSAESIIVKTTDPDYQCIQGELMFDKNLVIFSQIYTKDKWAKAMRPGQRFEAMLDGNQCNFNITSDFINYLEDIAFIDEVYDAVSTQHDKLDSRTFWTKEGFMVKVDLSEEENEALGHRATACIRVTGWGEPLSKFKGCVYGEIVEQELEYDVDPESDCIAMLKDFLFSRYDEDATEKKADILPHIEACFIKEFARSLHFLQMRATNPLLRYKVLGVLRMLCTMADLHEDELYFRYFAEYIRQLIVFAQAKDDENCIKEIEVPTSLEKEDSVAQSADILHILSFFAKDFGDTNMELEAYFIHKNDMLSRTASLVQSYNRLKDLLDDKTLRGIKKQILQQLSVVTEGDSSLDLSNELEGIFGYEDDMREFKSSFLEAPKNAYQQYQPYNICKGICAMMNNRGGTIYIGVNDRGIPIGVQNDLEILKSKYYHEKSMDAYMLFISKKGEEIMGELFWKYVTLKPILEYNVLSIVIEPYPYDLVCLKDGTSYLRKNNASAPITGEDTKEDIRRKRIQNLRKSDDKVIVILDAIQKKKMICLHGYHSSNSGTIQNRKIEPFFLDCNEYVHGYEAESDSIKIFRISRIDKVAPLNDEWTHEDKHKQLGIDPFHMTGEQKINIRLKLKLQAKNAIEELYPGTRTHIKQLNNGIWELNTFAYHLRPLIAFYLSYAESVTIIEAEGLKEAIKAYIQKNINF